MVSRLWFRRIDEEKLFSAVLNVSHYAGYGEGAISTGLLRQEGRLSHIKKDFVLGKVRFWSKEGKTGSTPFMRTLNHSHYGDELVLTPEDAIDLRYHRHSRTIDEFTSLKRVELISAPEDDFVRKVFGTYYTTALVSRLKETDNHLLLYCNEGNMRKLEPHLAVGNAFGELLLEVEAA